MADKTQNLVLQWITLVLLVILCIGSFSWFAAPVIKFPTAKEIAADITIPEAPEAPVIDLTSVEEGIADIQSTLKEDEDWENEAETLATAEWEKRDYKEIYDFLGDEIDKREDIIYVREDKDTTFAGMDEDDKDAIVTQYVTVKYENSEGDKVKEDLTIITTIEEGEVEDQDIISAEIV